MVDFTSALYLGQRPLSVPFPPYLSVTTGKPAALYEPRLHQKVALEVASRQGLERGLLAPSTLHLFWDVISTLGRSSAVLLDEGMYPIGRWGALRAMMQGMPVTLFSSDNIEGLDKFIYTYRQQNRTPWIITDGWDIAKGKPAPLDIYLKLLKSCRESVLLVDDTQAFGVLGRQPTADFPYGSDGGGTLAYLSLKSPKIVAITSLAKGLGVPVAVLTGSEKRIRHYQQCSEIRVHTSPVSNLHAWAAWQSLETDRSIGNELREKLHQNVSLFRRTIQPIIPGGGWFSIQKLVLPNARITFRLYNQLKSQGIRSLLLANHQQPTVPEVAFCIRADHTAEAIMHTVRHIKRILNETSFHRKINNPSAHESLTNTPINESDPATIRFVG